jgi:hypothetical protein
VIAVRIALALAGVFTIASAVAELVAPSWFFETIGPYPPYNRHYIGDLGAFVLPLGIGLLLAARDPLRYRALVVLAAIGNLAHAANHLVDALPPVQLPRATLDAISLGAVGLVLAAIAVALSRRRTA